MLDHKYFIDEDQPYKHAWLIWTLILIGCICTLIGIAYLIGLVFVFFGHPEIIYAWMFEIGKALCQ